jgi:glucose-6-phosphate-specific signal transduction histidine kinase
MSAAAAVEGSQGKGGTGTRERREEMQIAEILSDLVSLRGGVCVCPFLYLFSNFTLYTSRLHTSTAIPPFFTPHTLASHTTHTNYF